MKLNVITVPVGPLSANCHIVTSNESANALIIDPGGDFSLIKEQLDTLKKSAAAVILTHAHFDHILATSKFQSIGAKVYLNEKDEKLLNSNGNLAKYFGLKLEPFSVDNRLIEGDLDIFGFKTTVIETPGHTEGSVCIKIGNALFTGDTIFVGGYGRTDFPSGNAQQLKQSAQKLFNLTENLALYTGHGESGWLDNERKTNPINFLF